MNVLLEWGDNDESNRGRRSGVFTITDFGIIHIPVDFTT